MQHIQPPIAGEAVIGVAIDVESIHSTSLPQIVNNIGFTDACGAQIHA